LSALVALAAVREYLAAPRCAVISTLTKSGEPAQAVVHYLPATDHLIVNGRSDRRWVINLKRDPRVSLVIHDADQAQHWVGLRGVTELLTDPAAAVHDAMTIATRYGEDPMDFANQDRVSFRLMPRGVFEYGKK
jgi:PPOX class probable F420-dependent enzyme